MPERGSKYNLYRCPHCDYQTPRRWNLVQHIKRIHKKTPPEELLQTSGAYMRKQVYDLLVRWRTEKAILASIMKVKPSSHGERAAIEKGVTNQMKRLTFVGQQIEALVRKANLPPEEVEKIYAVMQK